MIFTFPCLPYLTTWNFTLSYWAINTIISSQPVPLFWELHLNAGAQVEPQLHCQLRVVERGTSVLRTRSISHHLPWCPRRPRAHHQLWAGHGGSNLALFFSLTKNHFCSEPRSGIWTVGMFTVELSIDLILLRWDSLWYWDNLYKHKIKAKWGTAA